MHKYSALLKRIFGYTEALAIREQYIFFAGAEDVDGLHGNEKALLAAVAQIVGQDNILVKVHPRSSVEWYQENGYHINANTSVPWEVYCLDASNLKNKVLIGIFSTALLTPYLYCNLENKIISLVRLFDKSSYPDVLKYAFDFIEQKIFLNRKDIFLLPSSIQELQHDLAHISSGA